MGVIALYEKYVKRILDVVCSIMALLVFAIPFLVFALIGSIAMKGWPFFLQTRPGKNEKLFRMIKFRTMSNTKDKNGDFLPDKERLNAYGKWLRSTSIDELPQLFNIIKGDMSIVGPRPKLISDMVFMNCEQRRRHEIRPGLTGLAQVSGRNNLDWEEVLKADVYYRDNITFFGDIKIIFKTIEKVISREDIAKDGLVTSLDYGDYLLQKGRITKEYYYEKHKEARYYLN
ncbi:MAG: sugar transferase [Christensenellales bacterium]|jgi:lipopolysaccharide/colanic/teichoic acid biosynthesis glycosyltransferase